MPSILNSIKKLLGINYADTQFDIDLIIHINTVMMILTQMGIGPSNGYHISDATQTWEDYLGNEWYTESVKTYIFLKVRLIFDPPQSSALIDAIKQTISELEWRLNSASDYFNI